MRTSTLLLLCLVACSGEAPSSVEQDILPKCPAGYQYVCSGDGPNGGVICDCECINACPSSFCPDLQTDSDNCGACGHACGLGQACQTGVCTTTRLRIALILVSAPGAPTHPNHDLGATADVFYSPSLPGSAYAFFDAASYHVFKIAGNTGGDGGINDVYGPFTVTTSGCIDEASAVAAAGSVIDYSLYDALVFLVNDPAHCGSGGGQRAQVTVTAAGKPKTMPTDRLFGLMGNNSRIDSTTIHELGHVLGFGHAAGWDCQDVTQDLNGKCIGQNYRDVTDSMGSGVLADFNPVHKERVGWLKGVRTVTATATGYYPIYAYEDPSPGAKVLKIPRKLDASGKPSGYYYLVYRQPFSPWAGWLGQASSFANGIALYMDERSHGSDTQLLDTTPGSTADEYYDFDDAALLPGKNFTDTPSGVSVDVLSVNQTYARLYVTLTPRGNQRYVQVQSDDYGSDGPHVPGVSITGAGLHHLGDAVTVGGSAPAYNLAWWTDTDGHTIATGAPFALTSSLAGDVFLTATFKEWPPANDDFGSAVVISALPASFTLNPATATVQTGAGEPTTLPCGGPIVGTVWYRYTPPVDQPVTITTAGSDHDTTIAVYQGSAVNMLIPETGACAFQDAPHPLDPSVHFTAHAGIPYAIQIGSPSPPGIALGVQITSP